MARRIWILSDLHRDVGPPFTPETVPTADLAVIAGDVSEGLEASIEWAANAVGRYMPVVLVPGNHEFYGSILQAELRRGRETAARLGVHLLSDDTVDLAGLRITGTTLWTDYALNGTRGVGAAMLAARRGLNDHRRIRWSEAPSDEVGRPFDPEHAAALHADAHLHLLTALLRNHADAPRQVVVTHHAPSPRSVSERWRGNSPNPAFASDLGDLLAAAQPALWVHGHTHSSFDYRIGATRVVCNPKGYGDENPAFDPALVVEVGA
jgi:hypothetical protein